MEPQNFEQTPAPRSMNQRTVILTITLFVLIVVGMFVFAFMKKDELKDQQQPTPEPTVEEDKYAHIDRIDGKHFYSDGVHTVVGEVPMPTPCDLLEVDAIVRESYPEQIQLDFSVLNNAEFCAEVVTPQRFKISASAHSPDADFRARFNGRSIELNLTPALPGETPEDFELFIKG